MNDFETVEMYQATMMIAYSVGLDFELKYDTNPQKKFMFSNKDKYKQAFVDLTSAYIFIQGYEVAYNLYKNKIMLISNIRKELLNGTLVIRFEGSIDADVYEEIQYWLNSEAQSEQWEILGMELFNQLKLQLV